MIFSQKRQENNEEKIKVKAYLLWEKDGNTEGISEQYYWYKAIDQYKKEKSLIHLFKKWGHQIEKCPKFILAHMQQSKILKIIILLGNLSIGITATTFLVTDKQRHDLKIIQSWQVINSASGKSSDGGMKKALEFLNSNRKSPYDRGQRRFPVFWKHWTPQALNRLDAPNIYLRGIKLPGAFLDEANFQNTDLGYANLERANLKDANLQEAILESSNLQESFLLNANLQKSTLQNASLIGATLLSANLMDANLNGSDLRGATLQMANLKNANLYRAKLEYTVLWQADLEGAFLGNVNLEKQSLSGVNLKNAIMWGANLQGAELDGVFLQGAYLTGANLKGATVVITPGFSPVVWMQEAKLIGTNLDQVDLSGVDLRKAIYSDLNTHPSVCERYQLQFPCPTIFPKGFNPKAAGMIKVHLEEISKR